jgi:hypothetical protein
MIKLLFLKRVVEHRHYSNIIGMVWFLIIMILEGRERHFSS